MQTPWAVVLAAGEGRRLKSLTVDPRGVAVPKQYCSLRGGPSLLQLALRRVHAMAPLTRICTVVAAQHRVWRDAQLRHLLDDHIIEQPENRGTAHGILLALLHILARDPHATLILLPADHVVRDEALFARSLRRATECAAADRNSVILLGIEPDDPDTELGYLVPESRDCRQPSRLLEFAEKPSVEHARDLMQRGALWNAFIIAASARALLQLFGTQFLSTIANMHRAVGNRPRSRYDAIILNYLYQSLPTLDFSRDVLQGQESRLQVLSAPPCGWSDLGTPQRVSRALEKLPHGSGAADLISDAALGLDLAAQHWRIQGSGHRVVYGASSRRMAPANERAS